MNARCPDPLELDLILQMPATDPRRRHVDACVQCRGTLQALELFLEPGDGTDFEDLALADAELAARVEEALPVRLSGAPRMRRWGLALAAVLALCAVGLGASDLLRTGTVDPVQLGRHQRGTPRADRISVVAGPAGLELAWPDAPAAEEIVYLFFSEDMEELGRLHASGPVAVHPRDPLAGATYCQALAMSRGDVIARSSIQRFSPDPE